MRLVEAARGVLRGVALVHHADVDAVVSQIGAQQLVGRRCVAARRGPEAVRAPQDDAVGCQAVVADQLFGDDGESPLLLLELGEAQLAVLALAQLVPQAVPGHGGGGRGGGVRGVVVAEEVEGESAEEEQAPG